MKKLKRSGHIGVLTSGGDTPGLNAAIRGLGKINYVPLDHPWIMSSRNLETSFGD